MFLSFSERQLPPPSVSPCRPQQAPLVGVSPIPGVLPSASPGLGALFPACGWMGMQSCLPSQAGPNPYTPTIRQATEAGAPQQPHPGKTKGVPPSSAFSVLTRGKLREQEPPNTQPGRLGKRTFWNPSVWGANVAYHHLQPSQEPNWPKDFFFLMLNETFKKYTTPSPCWREVKRGGQRGGKKKLLLFPALLEWLLDGYCSSSAESEASPQLLTGNTAVG